MFPQFKDVVSRYQPAKGMDPAKLKTQYGDRLVFWGGGGDTQHVLPHGTSAEVRKDVPRNIEAFKTGQWLCVQPRP